MAERSIGVHALVWVGGWGEANARQAMAGARDTGYNRIEIPLLLWEMENDMTRRLLQEHVSRGEIEDVKSALPRHLKEFWD